MLGSYGPGSALDNGGEHLRLVAWDNAVIREFVWDDVSPWPVMPDGEGPSLTLINPQTNPDPADPLNWRASTVPGGTPGFTDVTAFTGNPNTDDDGDGITELCAYALGLHLPAAGESLPAVTLASGRLSWLIPFNPAAEDVQLIPEWSSNLQLWQPAATLFPAQSRVEGTSARAWRQFDTSGPPAERKIFLRVRVVRP